MDSTGKIRACAGFKTSNNFLERASTLWVLHSLERVRGAYGNPGGLCLGSLSAVPSFFPPVLRRRKICFRAGEFNGI